MRVAQRLLWYLHPTQVLVTVQLWIMVGVYGQMENCVRVLLVVSAERRRLVWLQEILEHCSPGVHRPLAPLVALVLLVVLVLVMASALAWQYQPFEY